MKKTIILIAAISLLTLSGCANTDTHNQGKKITELEQQLNDLQNKIGEQKECETKECETKKESKGKSLAEYIERRDEFKHVNPSYLEKIYTLKNDGSSCPKNSEGVTGCDLDMYILAKSGWEEKGNEGQLFFLERQSAAMPQYFGPFKDNLERIMKEAKEFQLKK